MPKKLRRTTKKIKEDKPADDDADEDAETDDDEDADDDAVRRL